MERERQWPRWIKRRCISVSVDCAFGLEINITKTIVHFCKNGVIGRPRCSLLTGNCGTDRQMHYVHDDFIKWKHLPRYYYYFVCVCVWGGGGGPLVTGGFLTQRPVTRSFDVFLTCTWTNGWIDSQDAGNLRRHRAHYDVIVMDSYRQVIRICMHYHR